MSLTKTIFVYILFNVCIACAHAATLGESFNRALLNNQSDNINESRLRQGVELKKIGQGAYLPSLAVRGTYLKQESFNDQKTLGLNLTTSLYNGGRDSKQIQNAETGIQIARNQRQIDRVNLYTEVVDAYYAYLINVNDIKNLELLKKQSQERADEIRKRVSIGRSRSGELFQAEAQLASVEAQTSEGIGLLNQSEARLMILTGLNKSELNEIKIEKSTEAKTLAEYLAMALGREDIQNKELSIKQINTDVSIAKSYYLPKLDLLSNWYALKKGGSTSSRDSNWDVGLNLVIPLYEGGVSQAQVRESIEKKQLADYQLLDYKKSITIDVTSRYEVYQRYVGQMKAFDLALEKAKRSYDETVKDYRLGLVSNLDVLSSLNLYLGTKRDSEKTRIRAILNQRLLEAVAGVIPQV